MSSGVSSTRLMIAAVMAILVYGMIAATLGTVLKPMSDKFHLTPEENGYIALAQAIGLVIASLSVGPLLDNKGKKTGLLLGLALIVIALFALPNATGYEMIMGCFVVMGMGGSVIVTGANALVSDISEGKRATTFNLLNLFFGLGGLLTPFVAANVFHGDAFLLLYSVAGLTVVTLLVHATTKMPPPSGERGFKLSEAGLVLGRPALWLLSLFLFLYVSCEVGIWNWLVKYLVEVQKLPEATALNILSLGFALGLLVGRVVVSPILIKISAPMVTLVSAVLMSFTTYWVLNVQDATTAGIAVFCAGLAMAPVFPTTLAMTGDAFPRATGTALGIVITFGWVGLAVSSRIIGAVAGDDPNRLKTALLVLPVCSAAMVLVNLVIRVVLPRKAAA